MTEIKETWTWLNVLVSCLATINFRLRFSAIAQKQSHLLSTLTAATDRPVRDIWLAILRLLYDHYRFHLRTASIPGLYEASPRPGQR